MKRLTAALGFFISLALFMTTGSDSLAQGRADRCSLKGAVFIESSRSFAQYKVYVEDSEGLADLRVFKADSRLFADEPGKWYIVDKRGFADFTIFIEKQRSFADFTIYYTKHEAFAGCQ